jgi:hypothetical protein
MDIRSSSLALLSNSSKASGLHVSHRNEGHERTNKHRRVEMKISQFQEVQYLMVQSKVKLLILHGLSLELKNQTRNRLISPIIPSKIKCNSRAADVKWHDASWRQGSIL